MMNKHEWYKHDRTEHGAAVYYCTNTNCDWLRFQYSEKDTSRRARTEYRAEVVTGRSWWSGIRTKLYTSDTEPECGPVRLT